MARPPIKSTEQDFGSMNGNPLTFKKDVPRRIDGKRVVIDGVTVIADFTDINVATTAVQGEDLYRAFKRIHIEQTDGHVRWNLRGDESRLACYMLEGPEHVHEHADSATTTNQAIVVKAYIPLRKRRAVRGKDFSLPAEFLKRIRIETGDLSEMGVSGGTVTVDAATYYVLYHYRLVDSIALYVPDAVTSTEFDTTTKVEVSAGGRMTDLAFFARGASGGASVANFTDVRSPELMPDTLTKAELLEGWQRDYRNVTNLSATQGSAVRLDPFTAGRAVPVLWSKEDERNIDAPLVEETNWKCTNSVASLIAVHRVIHPRNKDIAAATVRRHKVPINAFRMKTAAKSRRAPEAWDSRDAAFLPMTAPDTQVTRAAA